MKQKLDKLIRNLRGNTHAQIALCGIGVAFVFLISAILPILVQDRFEPAEEVQLGMRQRSAVYLRYSAGGTGCTVERQSPDDFSPEETAASDAALLALRSAFVVDREEGSTASEGTEYLTITYGGDTIRVCHYYREWSGDWGNWLEAYVDVESGDLYYLYVSSQRKANVDYSGIRMDNRINAERLAKVMDYELVSFTDTNTNTATSVYLTESSAAKYNMSCIYHVNNLLDIKFTVTE